MQAKEKINRREPDGFFGLTAGVCYKGAGTIAEWFVNRKAIVRKRNGYGSRTVQLWYLHAIRRGFLSFY